MFNQSKRASVLFWSLEILIVCGIIYICNKINFIFDPIGIFISTIFVPLLLAGALFYMLNPIVDLIQKVKIGRFHISRTWAVTIIFIAFLGVIVYLGVSFLPRLVNQVTNLVNHLSSFTNATEDTLNRLLNHGALKNVDVDSYVDKIQGYFLQYSKNVVSGLTNSLGSIISMATSVVVTIITVPVVLFYMLKDGNRLRPTIAKLIPPKRRTKTMELLDKMNETIARYIGGQMIECLFVGVFTSLGYVIIGQKYALSLGVFAGICNIIPYVGPYIGIIPSVLLALSTNIQEVIYVVIVVIIVQQLDGNLVYPNVIGKSLQIHPLTIIVILLAAGNIAGLMGMILAIPLYAVIKVIVQHLYTIWLIQREEEDQETSKKEQEKR